MTEMRSICTGAARDPFTFAVLIAALAYVGLAWTPSSYERVFQRIGVPGTGLVLGEAREIRSDEWALWTPYIQAAVNTGFSRFNTTSLYREDFRNFNGLPLADWAILFKPYFWPFFVLDPGHAFSFYHAFFIASFLLGYQRLLRAIFPSEGQAVFGSLVLFFSSFVQTWWTTLGPVVAGFPWILLIAMASFKSWLRMLVMAYATAAWLLAHLYAPTMITLAFAGLVFLLTFRPESLRPGRAIVSVLGVAIGGALVWIYLRDVVPLVASTHYPGQRAAGGGVDVPRIQWIAQLFPFFVTSGFSQLVSWNVCESSTVGTHLPVLSLLFCDYRILIRRLRSPATLDRRLRWQLVVLSLGVTLTSLWLLLPVPEALGVPLLWHMVPAIRMWFTCGFLVFLLALCVLNAAPVRLSAIRAGVLAIIVFAMWYVSQRVLGDATLIADWVEIAILAPVAVILVFRAKLAARLPAAMVAAAAVANGVGWGGFNPIQSAKPIFDRPETPITIQFERLAERHSRGWLVVDGAYGAWLNGWGFASATHVLLAPRLESFRSLLPDLDAERFDYLFNRSIFVAPTVSAQPYLIDPGSVFVPIDAFDPVTIGTVLERRGGGSMSRGGLVSVRRVFESGRQARGALEGWARFDSADPSVRLRVQTDAPLRGVVAYPSMRFRDAEDGALDGSSGFTLSLSGTSELGRFLNPRFIRIVSEDPEGRRLSIPWSSSKLQKRTQ
jgi:hypothetical protein